MNQKFNNFIEDILKEGKLILLNSPQKDSYNKIKILENPTKYQVENLLKEDKFHILRGFITENNLYCWRSYSLTHQEALNNLLSQEGLQLNPICGIVFNENHIQLANSWNNIKINKENINLILHHPILEYLFGKDYQILGLL